MSNHTQPPVTHFERFMGANLRGLLEKLAQGPTGVHEAFQTVWNASQDFVEAPPVEQPPDPTPVMERLMASMIKFGGARWAADSPEFQALHRVLQEFWPMPTVAFYSVGEAEELHYTTVEEAVNAYLDDIPEGQEPETLELVAYARVRIKDQDVLSASPALLRDILDRFDETWGAGDNGTVPSAKMEELTNRYLLGIADLYVPWACEEVARETINVQEWIDGHKAVAEALEAVKSNAEQPIPPVAPKRPVVAPTARASIPVDQSQASTPVEPDA